MKKKLLSNVIFNIALILSVMGAVWAFENQSPLIGIFFITVFITTVFFKIKLVRSINKEFKQPKSGKKI